MKKGQDFTGITIVYFCHDGNSNVLLNKRGINCRDEHGAWDCGSGALEFEDEVEQTLKREISEEYCAEILNKEFLGYRDVHRENNGQKTHWIALDFKVQINREQAQNGEPHKFDAVEWFPLDKLPTPLHSQLPYFLEKYADKLKISEN